MPLEQNRAGPTSGETPHRIVLIRLRSLGDTVLMTPCLSVLKRLPGWETAVVVEEPFHQVLQDNPHLDRLFVIPRTSGKLASRLGVLRQIRAFRPEVAVDLHGGSTSALLTLASGARTRLGYGQNRYAAFYNTRVPPSGQIWAQKTVHTVEHQLAPLKYLGFPADPIPPLEVALRPELVRQVQGSLPEHLTDSSEGFVLIHPAAAFDTKQWEAGKFAQLANRLVGMGIPVAITAGPGEESLLQEIGNDASMEIHFLPPLPLPRFTALASLCRLYIGNDSGATHIVAALKKPIVVIFGSSDSTVWHPWQTEYRLLRSDLPCIPCPGYECLHFDQPKCIRSIEVDEVWSAAREFWTT